MFSGHGQKFTESLEREVEAIVAANGWTVPASAPAHVAKLDVMDAYLAHARLALPDPQRLGRFKIAVDSANGATTTVAPRLFSELGFDVHLLGANPDGRNINLDCGSTHPRALARAVRDSGARWALPSTATATARFSPTRPARVVDGDAVLLMCGRQMKATGRLAGNTVVATVMSNIGLEIALRASGIDLVRCPVGDKYVMEEMIKRELSLGGEQSGHVIFSDHLFTGDGIATAMNVLRVMAETGRELADLAAELVTYPQVLINVRVREKKDLQSVPAIAAAMDRVEDRLAGQGRLLVRYSGTEPLMRVMMEGRDQHEIQALGVRDRRRREGASRVARSCRPRLSVNVNKVATLRNSRGGEVPSVLEAVDGLHRRRRARHHRPPARRRTAHHAAGRPRHRRGSAPRRGHVEFNIEGDPRPDLLDARRTRSGPIRCTLVPVRPGEITSQAGWPPDTPADELANDRSAPEGSTASASACSSIRIRRPSAGRRRWAPTASSSTPSRSRARSRRAAERGSASFDALRRCRQRWRTRSGSA